MSSIAKLRSLFSNKTSILSPLDVSRMGPDHVKRAEKLINRTTYALFGDVDLEDMVARSFFSLQVEDDEGKLAGVLITHVSPNVPAVPPWDWEHWVVALYGLEGTNTRNTLWVQLMLWDINYYFLFLQPLVQRLFQLRSFLRNLVMVLPPGASKIEFLGNLGTRVFPKGTLCICAWTISNILRSDCTNPKSCQTLFLMQRHNFLKSYKLRRAVEEDNDDLVPLIGSQSKRLEELYGKFYIAELLTRHQDSGRQILVAEHNGVAVAVLCLNSIVNYKILNDEFEVMTFNGFKKYHPDDMDLALQTVYPNNEPLPNSSEEDSTRPPTVYVTEYYVRAPRPPFPTVTPSLIPPPPSRVLQIVERKSYESEPIRSDHEMLVHVTATSSDDFSLVFTSASIFVFQDDDDKHSQVGTMDDQDLLSEFGDILRKMPKLPDLPDLDTLSVYTDVAKPRSVGSMPRFAGEPNAFAVEVAAALPDHEHGLLLLFESSFDCYRDRDYAILSIPSTYPMNKLTELFIRVTPRPSSTFPLELYVLHKSAVLGTVNVVAASPCHSDQIHRLLSTIPNNYMVRQQYDNYLHDAATAYLVYVMTCEDQVVGIATLSEEFDAEYLQAHYEIIYCADRRLFKSGCHGLIESLVMSPIFHNHANYFLRELHRQSDFSILYYKQTPYDSSHYYRERPLVNLLHTLFPIMPRYQPDYDQNVLKEEECEVSPVITEKKLPFALYVSTMPKCSVSRYIVNIKIVVVGASNTAIAFLESLILSQSPKLLVTFNNVTLVGNHGIKHLHVASKFQEAFMVKKYFIDQRYMELLSMRTYVNYVQGRITKIDRKEKFIVVNDNSYLAYDLLFLMAGESFLKPKRQSTATIPEEPINCFVVNDAIDAHNAVLKLKQQFQTRKVEDYVIIVYGHFLEAYCTVHGLLTYGIPGSHIVMIEPFPFSMALEKRHRHNVSMFNDPEVDEAVLKKIKAQGITMYASYYFVDWEYDPEENIITAAKFESRHKMLELECFAMFYFHTRSVSPRIYRVINEAGLVYDGRLVIDKNCRTNDPNIYGAGTLTKYSRKYYASHMIHKYYNRREIGHRLGQQIKEMLLPRRIVMMARPNSGWNFDVERGENLVPRYEKPIMRYCRLPGGLYYMSVVKPGRKEPLETTLSMENHGQFLITGNCNDLDKQGLLQAPPEPIQESGDYHPIDIHNICALWGKHEKLLNNLQLRFEMGVITDLYEYFKQPWAYAIYHDRFEALLDDLNSLVTSTMFNQEISLVSELIEAYKEVKWKELTADQKDVLEDMFALQTYPKILEQKVLEFVQTNLDHLPMYAHPLIVKTLLSGYKNSPMFSK
ncbi:hypothetical protein NQ318_015093 [Aromia moschata]|uniref:Cilia- and flagella-associated protein 61 N-terminal domain-containing protein n=1 Tax=Aromia moschata TaxID=1265417 RepID=A0AAV8YXJ2_9CUCU|nr:hypothetical protein NQ318_015093 [Aromia moschata]